LCLFGLGGTFVGTVAPAHAHKRNFSYTYEWFTPQRGERELELWGTFKNESREWVNQLELEYGVTDRWVVAPYLLFGGQPGDRYRFLGYKFEQRYRFGQFKERHVLPAVYLELNKEGPGEPHRLESKAIFSWYRGPWAFSANAIAVKALEPGGKVEWEHACGLGRNVGRRWFLGGEVWGSFADKEHFAGPVLAFDLKPTARHGVHNDYTSRIVATAGTGLGNGRSKDYQFRLVWEVEWLK
jgi:hypothetical protein